MISQLTVFLENEEGRLASAVRTIADANINMQALFLADTSDFGILRIFWDTPQKACDALTESYLNDNNINVEYAHCFISGDYAFDVLKVNDASLDVKLAAAGFDVCKPEDVYVTDW